MLSLNEGSAGLVLPQLIVPCFVDSPWEPLAIERSGHVAKVGGGAVHGI